MCRRHTLKTRYEIRATRYVLKGLSFALRRVLKTGKFVKKVKLNGAGRTMTLFSDDDLCLVAVLDSRVLLGIVLLAVKKDDHISILFDGARLTKIRKLGAVPHPAVHLPVQLTDPDDRYPKLPGKGLERTGYLRYLLLTALPRAES
jgi:hypothetical protein